MLIKFRPLLAHEADDGQRTTGFKSKQWRNQVPVPEFMNKMLSIIALIGCIAASSSYATQIGPGYISQPDPSSNGAMLFYLVDSTGKMLSRTGLPNCAVTQPSRWAVDASDSTGGLMQASALMELWKNHTPVIITGQNACSIWADTETVGDLLASW